MKIYQTTVISMCTCTDDTSIYCGDTFADVIDIDDEIVLNLTKAGATNAHCDLVRKYTDEEIYDAEVTENSVTTYGNGDIKYVTIIEIDGGEETIQLNIETITKNVK